MSLDRPIRARAVSRRMMLGGIAAGAATAILAACGTSSGATDTAKPAGATGATSATGRGTGAATGATGGSTPAATSATTGNTAATSAPAKTGSAPVTLKFWASVRGGTEFITASQNLCAAFTKQNPNVTVTWEGIPAQGWYEKYTTAIASGTGPDISTGTAYQAFQFYDTNNILPIDDVIKDWQSQGVLDQFLPNVIKLQQYDNHTIALPWAFDIRVAYYRKDLFQAAGLQPPTNWDEWRAAAKKLTSGDVYGQVISGDTLGWHNLMFFLLGNGGGPFTADKKANLASDPRNVEAAQFIANLVKDGSVNPAGPGYISDDALKSYSTGKAALYIANPLLESRVPDIADKIGIIPPLTAPHNDKGSVMWVNNTMIFNSTKHPDEAKQFLKWWTLNNKPLWTEGHVQTLPVVKSLVNDPYIQGNANATYIINNYLPIGKPVATHFEGLFPQLNTFEGDGTLITLNQDLLTGKDPMMSLQKADAAVKKIIGQT